MTEAMTSAEPPIRIEIVSPVYNRRETTLQCLRSLARIDQTNLQVHVIIVDDGSSDGTGAAIREQFPEVEIVPGDGNLHFTRGTNLGVETALAKDPDYILTMNDDSIFHEQFLQRLVACARRHPHSVVGPMLLLWDQPHRVMQIGGRWRTWYGGWHTPFRQSAWDLPREPFTVDVIVGNCILFPVAAIREQGLMLGDAFRWGFGDMEWTPRMKRGGWRLLIEPRAMVWFEPNTMPKSPSKMRIAELVRVLFIDRRNPYNLKSQFIGRWYSAPSRLSALIAFFVWLIRFSLRGFGLDRNWPQWPDESLKDRSLTG